MLHDDEGAGRHGLRQEQAVSAETGSGGDSEAPGGAVLEYIRTYNIRTS